MKLVLYNVTTLCSRRYDSALLNVLLQMWKGHYSPFGQLLITRNFAISFYILKIQEPLLICEGFTTVPNA